MIADFVDVALRLLDVGLQLSPPRVLRFGLVPGRTRRCSDDEPSQLEPGISMPGSFACISTGGYVLVVHAAKLGMLCAGVN